MTDRIKSARVEFIKEARFLGLPDEHIQTILEALSAYGKLQGVDLNGLERVRKYIFDAYDEKFPENDSIGWRDDKPIDVTFKDLVEFNKTAQLLAGIRGK